MLKRIAFQHSLSDISVLNLPGLFVSSSFLLNIIYLLLFLAVFSSTCNRIFVYLFQISIEGR